MNNLTPEQEECEAIRDESGRKLKPCPECKSDQFLQIDSCGHMGISQVTCDCGHVFESRCYEENIGRHWNKHCKNFK